MSKRSTSGLTRLRRSQAAEARDPDAYHLQWRLRALRDDLWALRIIADRNRRRWPEMEEQLRQVSLTVLCHLNTVETACDRAGDDIV